MEQETYPATKQLWHNTTMKAKLFLPRRQKNDLEHERLTSLVNSLGDGVLAIDQRMNIVLSNGAALNILDVNSSLHGRALADVFKPQDRNNQPIDIIEMVRAAKTPVTNRDLVIKYQDGSAINLYLSIAPVHLGYGRRGIRGHVLLLRDITREKSLEEERDEFISVVGHELRTPIAITEGNISNAQFIAERTGDLGQIKAALKEAHDQILFLAAMVNDLATLSRAERGKLTLEIEPISVAELLQDLAQNYRPQAAERKLALKTELHGNHNAVLQSGKLYVREILQNFITNAIKYTENGSVTIIAETDDRGVMFRVRDTGIGISKSDKEKLFDKFFRSEDYRTRKTNGTGLGLYVSMKLARLLHADIDVQTKLDKGSTFSIFVPNLK